MVGGSGWEKVFLGDEIVAFSSLIVQRGIFF